MKNLLCFLLLSMACFGQSAPESIGYKPRSIGYKLRRAAQSAVNNNQYVIAPLIAPIAWSSSTSYAVGNVVQLGGNAYVCIAGGTSAASVGPASTGANFITDGTVTWSYYGPPNPTVSYSLAPVFSNTITLPAALTKTVAAAPYAGHFRFIGAFPQVYGGAW